MRPLAIRTALASAAIVAALGGAYCGGNKSTSPTPTPTTDPPGVIPNPNPNPVPSQPVTFVGAGDIGWCGKGAEPTARLVQGINGQVFTAGDNAYLEGSIRNFMDCYAPTWGRFVDRTRPVPGNHEYDTDNLARGYYTYFGNSASQVTQGYYAYDVGDWRVIALNSALPGVGFGAAQLRFLDDELRLNTKKCVAAIWHHPLFTSGPNGPNRYTREVWQRLYDANADLIINGHDHLYERFAQQDPDGRRDTVRGIRQFTVGTGGAELYAFTPNISPNSEVRISQWGVIRLTLHSDKYEWQFVPVSGGGDSGQQACH